MDYYNRSKLLQILLLAVLSLIAAYFSFHLVFGDHSLFILIDKKLAYQEYLDKFEKLKHRKNKLESQVKGLEEESLDLDLLDEKVREILGYSNPKERIILDPYRKRDHRKH